MDKIVIHRQIIEFDNKNNSIINIEEYLSYIKTQGDYFASTTRRSRKFLRDIGMIDKKGNFIDYKSKL